MHTFQPYPIDKMEFNPFTKILITHRKTRYTCNNATTMQPYISDIRKPNKIGITPFLTNQNLYGLAA